MFIWYYCTFFDKESEQTMNVFVLIQIDMISLAQTYKGH